MPRDARFWRNVTIIAVAHIAIIVTLVRWDVEARRPNLQSIVWMSGGGAEVAAPDPPALAEAALEKTPPARIQPKPQEQDEPAAPTLAQSDLQLPPATPSPAAVPTSPPKPMTPVPNSSPRAIPKVTPKRTRKKPIVARVTPKSSPKKERTPAEEEAQNEKSREATTKIAPANANPANGDKSAPTGPSGTAPASEFSRYGKMLHDRFYGEWIQPTTSAPIGVKISTLARIRIEKDGRVSSFTLVKPSGNVVVDESVAAVAKRVTQVDPLPMGLGGREYYEVNINFELSPNR